MKLNRYKSHKTVHAAVIVDFAATHDGTCWIDIADADGHLHRVDVPIGIFARYTPTRGVDALVWYDRGTADEYISISPGAKFAAGYSLTDPEPGPIAPGVEPDAVTDGTPT